MIHENDRQPAAELRQASKRYGPVTALDRLDFAVQPGEVVALLGPNGAGKTTTVQLLLGLAQPSAGTARLFGRDPRDAAARVRIGAMLQVSKVPETLKVREHVDLISSYYPKPLPRAEVIGIAGLSGLEDRPFGKLSGGQRQRVLFALALCGDPDLLFLDEPTTGLDVEARRGLWSAMRELVGRGRTVLLTTHHLEEADALASRIVVLDRGRILAQGSPAEIKARVDGRRIRCATRLSLDELSRLPGVVTARRDGAQAELTTARAEGVVAELLRRDPDLSGLEVLGAGLEEAFLALTQPSDREERAA
jgi:ABC-2 type transport system ATP-binding protein